MRFQHFDIVSVEMIHNSFGGKARSSVLRDNAIFSRNYAFIFGQRHLSKTCMYCYLHIVPFTCNGLIPFQEITLQTVVFLFRVFDSSFHTVRDKFLSRSAPYKWMSPSNHFHCCVKREAQL
jgi:hypothetical protein